MSQQTTNDPIITSEFQPTAGIIGPFQRFFKNLVVGSYPLFLAVLNFFGRAQK